MSKEVHLPIIWDEKYDKLGVSPYELYLRQQGICFPVAEINLNGTVTLYCTDGEEKALTEGLLNPTFECMRCLVRFSTKAIKDATT